MLLQRREGGKTWKYQILWQIWRTNRIRKEEGKTSWKICTSQLFKWNRPGFSNFLIHSSLFQFSPSLFLSVFPKVKGSLLVGLHKLGEFAFSTPNCRCGQNQLILSWVESSRAASKTQGFRFSGLPGQQDFSYLACLLSFSFHIHAEWQFMEYLKVEINRNVCKTGKAH